MDAPADSFREWFERIRDEHPHLCYLHVLVPWIESHGDEVAWLKQFASRPGLPVPPAEAVELWALYALSRVNEVLLLNFQPRRDGAEDRVGSWPLLSLDEYELFAASIGLTACEQREFSPFYHEIVSVELAADDDQPTRLESMAWPGFMLGDMMFSRAGVRVSAGRRVLSKELAETSTLYWTFLRKHRPVSDLSHGWGSNSQWRTPFRRDYRFGRQLHFNVDGKVDLNAWTPDEKDADGFDAEQLIELTIHRCLVKTLHRHDDLYPFDLRYTGTL